MVSFIITSRDKDKRVVYAKDFCAKQHIDRFDITLIERDQSEKNAKLSIGIEDVKLMQKKISLKPMKSPTKAVIIEDAHLLTTEAQNALLKVLEEPPANTILILGTDSKEALLPTIRSRCQLIELEEALPKLTEKDKTTLNEFIKALPTMTIGERLKKAESLAKDRDKAIAWIEKLILVTREELLQNYMKNTPPLPLTFHFSLLTSFQSLYTTLKTTNVNPRMAIENTLLSLIGS